jgi:hypothetical protein
MPTPYARISFAWRSSRFSRSSALMRLSPLLPAGRVAFLVAEVLGQLGAQRPP